jgi:acyl-CoA dehydrogenase
MATNSINPIPFSEPPYLRGLPSPYITDAHRRFQQACRRFAWEHLLQHAMEWEREGTVPVHVFHTFCKHNMLLPNMPAPLPVDWLKRLGINDILGVKVEDWDYIYTGIYADEVNCEIPTDKSSMLTIYQ